MTATRGARAASPWVLVLLVAAAACAGRGPKQGPAPPTNQEYYDQAREMIAERRFEKARETLNVIGTREAQSADLDPLVKLAIADSYFFEPGIVSVIEAQSRYQQFLTYYPSNALAGYAQFQLGMCYLRQSPQPHHDQTFTHRAIEEFDKVRLIDPNGAFVRAAEAMRGRCNNKLAMHDYQVGYFYYRRKAYPAVVARFRALLETYPSYERIDAVYYYLGLSLIQTGNAPEGRIYLEKIQRDSDRDFFMTAEQAERSQRAPSSALVNARRRARWSSRAVERAGQSSARSLPVFPGSMRARPKRVWVSRRRRKINAGSP